MKFLKPSLFALLVVGFVACKKDDDSTSSCTQSDWVGTYEGTTDCGGTSEDVIVTITASGSDAIVIEYETATLTTTYDPITPTDCDLNSSGTDSGITIKVDAALDGDKLTLEETISGGGVDFTCNLTATRK
ncbi:MAG: hypothetical protein IPN76_05810 [Saprospiraceae bacterium]|nr:hypothetical protein [Saprospiraceae bacterium]